MGKSRPPQPVKLIVGLLASSPSLLDEARAALADIYGAIDASSPPAPWSVSSYYTDEMGAEITRQFVAFATLIEADAIASIKTTTNDLEDRWRRDGRRQVNIDPGYIALTKLVLATTKDAAQRIYIGGGIYAEPTLSFESGSFRPYAHTYRDYADGAALEFFNRLRALYVEQRRGAPPALV